MNEEEKEWLTDEEKLKIMDILNDLSRAYWRIWFGKAIFNSKALLEDLERAKKKLQEMGV